MRRRNCQACIFERNGVKFRFEHTCGRSYEERQKIMEDIKKQEKEMELFDDIRAGVFGLLVGDALGVPVEFTSRAERKADPVTDMRGYGVHYQPPGTWSDDGSMALCILDGISDGKYNPAEIAKNFLGWFEENLWTPHGVLFDIGNTTVSSLRILSRTHNYRSCGQYDEGDNGNGSLMRCLPLVYLIKDMSIEERYEIVREVSAMTHGHILSVMCNFFYLEVARALLVGHDKLNAYGQACLSSRHIIIQILSESEKSSLDSMKRLLWDNVYELPEEEIFSSGYVLHTLEASIWCLMKYDTFEETVLAAVNLGSDTDTTGAVAGGLAGILYGFYKIPAKWVGQLARLEDIISLTLKFAKNLSTNGNSNETDEQGKD